MATPYPYKFNIPNIGTYNDTNDPLGTHRQIQGKEPFVHIDIMKNTI